MSRPTHSVTIFIYFGDEWVYFGQVKVHFLPLGRVSKNFNSSVKGLTEQKPKQKTTTEWWYAKQKMKPAVTFEESVLANSSFISSCLSSSCCPPTISRIVARYPSLNAAIGRWRIRYTPAATMMSKAFRSNSCTYKSQLRLSSAVFRKIKAWDEKNGPIVKYVIHNQFSIKVIKSNNKYTKKNNIMYNAQTVKQHFCMNKWCAILSLWFHKTHFIRMMDIIKIPGKLIVSCNKIFGVK